LRKENLTEEQAHRKLEEVQDPDRHPYLLTLAGKSWGGEGGKDFDDFNKVAQQLMRKENLTEEQAHRKLEEVQGPDRHPYLL